MCRHKWVQVEGFYLALDKELDGIYLFCEKCHEVCAVSLKDVPRWEMNVRKKYGN